VLCCVAVCCIVLQCVAVCCSVLQCVAVCCSVLQCVAVCCGVKQVSVSEALYVLQRVAVCCSVLQNIAVFCGVTYECVVGRQLKSDLRKSLQQRHPTCCISAAYRYFSCEWVMAHMKQSKWIWMSHGTYEGVTVHLNKSWHTYAKSYQNCRSLLQKRYEQVILHMKESCNYVAPPRDLLWGGFG